MTEDRDRALVVIAVSSAAVFVGGLVSQGVAWSLALRLIVALGSIGVLCWQLVKWTDGDDEP